MIITAAVNDDLPDNLTSAITGRHVVTVQDTDDGRISLLDEQP